MPSANPAISSLSFFGLHLFGSFLFHLHLKVHIHGIGLRLFGLRLSCSCFLNERIMGCLQYLPRLISVFKHAIVIWWYSFVSHFFKYSLTEVFVHVFFFSLHSMLCSCPTGSSSVGCQLGCCWCRRRCDPLYCRSQGQGWDTTPTLPID